MKKISITFWVGLATLCVGVFMSNYQNNVLPAYKKEKDAKVNAFQQPMMAFEFAKTTEDIEALFLNKGVRNEPFIQKNICLNYFDFVFILCYVSFLGLYSLSFLLEKNKFWAYIGVILALLIGIFDVLENFQLLAILSAIPNKTYQANLANLHNFTWLKWGLLGIEMLVFIPFLFKNGKLGILMSFLALISASFCLIAYWHENPFWISHYVLSIFIMLILLVIYTLILDLRNEKIKP